MPARNLRIQELALGEIDDAFEWYRERSEEAAASFLSEIEHGLQAIVESPLLWPVLPERKRAGVRRYVLRKFPYDIVYLVSDELVEVIAVSHHKRDQGYWGGR